MKSRNAGGGDIGLETKNNIPLFFHRDKNLNPVVRSQGSSLMKGKPNISDDYVNVDMVNLPNFINKFKTIKLQVLENR